MKKILALVLTFALVFSTFGMAFADTTTTTPAAPALSADAKACADLGMLVGDGSGVTATYAAMSTTRIQAAVMMLRLKGLLTEAQAFTGTANFADANKAAWAAPIMAYLKAHPELGWVGDGTNLNPAGVLTAQAYYKVMLESLGYKANTAEVVGDFAYDKTIEFAATKGLSKVATATNFTVDNVATATVEALKVAVKGGTMTLAATLVAAGKLDAAKATTAGVYSTVPTTATVAAASAKTITATFATPVADTTKAVFTVKKGSTVMTVTTTWNEAKTVATLAAASNFAEATYTVNVAYDTKDLGSKDIAFTAQKVAKIEFSSPSVAVTVANGTGYVTYKVFDQYNNDITSTSMANSLTAQVGVTATTTIKNGLMTITAANPTLMTLQNLSVVLYDSSAGVTATKSLPISTAVGTLTDFALGDASNVKLVEGDTTTVFYIPFTAKDMAGNETKSYDLVVGGLIDANTTTATVTDLVVSLSNNVTAKVVKDPTNSKNAAIEVKYTGTSAYSMDMPVTITAMTYGGKTTSINTSLARAKAVDKIVLMAPADTVAATEAPTIPFEAYDANGNAITSFTYINNTTVTPNGFSITERANGTAKFTMTALPVKGVATLSANVIKSGKVSNLLQINVQDAKRPASIVFDSTKIVTAMEQGVNQIFYVGDPDDDLNADAIKVYDQYDRILDDASIVAAFGPNGAATNKYYVAVGVTGNAVMNTATMTNAADVNVTVATPDSATITFDLYKDTTIGGSDALVDSASVAVTCVATADIDHYTINSPAGAIFGVKAQASGGVQATEQERQYGYRVKVYGATTAGTKVLLNGSPIVNATLSNNTDFTVTNTLPANYKGIYVTANDLNNNRTSASTDVVITLSHNNKVTALKQTVTSTTTAPVAKDVKLSGASGSGIASNNLPNNTATVIAEFDAAGAATAFGTYFYIVDSYDTEGMDFASFKVAKVTNAAGTATYAPSIVNGITLTNAGVLTIQSGVAGGHVLVAGDLVYVTAVTNNGLSATMRFTVQ